MNHTVDNVYCDAKLLAETLHRTDMPIVFAESCTGGLISAALTRVPGISAQLCGSAVVYQIATKADWLGISAETLENPGPVSAEVAIQMATGVLKMTPAAKIAVSVTGHLGPDAPLNQDGLLFAAAAIRRLSKSKSSAESDPEPETTVRKHWLSGPADDEEAQAALHGGDTILRIDRQQEAAAFVLRFARSVITSIGR